jgi:hypothetical protein
MQNPYFRASALTIARIRRVVLVALYVLITTGSSPSAHADRTYRVYKADRFGVAEDLLNPSAIIEIDDFTGRGTVYEADSFGGPDIFKGPKYVIESDSLSPLPPLITSTEPCEDNERRSHRHRRPHDHHDWDDE